jgi:predicted nucleic acid-binding protein
MAFVVVYDACVLHDSLLRDLLIRLARKRKLNLQARWSEAILDEMVRTFLARRPDLDPDRLARTRQLMCDAIPDCLVTGFEALIEGLDLPDPGDRHVLAAGIAAGAQVIVTYNERHFPDAVLRPFDIEAQHPDEFLVSLFDLDQSTVREAFTELVGSLTRPPSTHIEVIAALRRRGLIRAAQRLG